MDAFAYDRVIRFADTDAAGVVYFANVLSICHEAYEASLAAAGIDLRTFFGAQAAVLPIVHAEVDLRRPMYCGDLVRVWLSTQPIDESSFIAIYHLCTPEGTRLAIASTRHTCIDRHQRTRHPLPAAIAAWLANHNHGEAPA